MSKVMIVEDDDSLREIYGIRLTAEGYAVVSARDGEEALAIAVKQRPDLIVSDVMMPKITGFDMLDILRSTPETKNIKVIMMTALSSEDQRERGENLGADRYIVKSQVGIEDVVNVVHEVLGDRNAAGVISTNPTVAQTGTEAAQGEAQMNPGLVQPTDQAVPPADIVMPPSAPVAEQPNASMVQPAAPVEVVAQPMAPVDTATQSDVPVDPAAAQFPPMQPPMA